MRSPKALGLPLQEGAPRYEGSGCPPAAGPDPGPMWCTLVTSKSMDFWRRVRTWGAASSSTAQSSEGGSALAWVISSAPNLPRAPAPCRESGEYLPTLTGPNSSTTKPKVTRLCSNQTMVLRRKPVSWTLLVHYRGHLGAEKACNALRYPHPCLSHICVT